MKCIAIDDEPRALQIIRLHAARIAAISKLTTFRSGLDAIDFLMHEKADLIFLDISMPDLTGIEFLQSLPQRPLVIFTTAYAEYAVQSYEFEAIDYLLKPIEFPRFLKAVNKANAVFQQRDPSLPDRLYQVKSGPETYQVNLNDILYIEASGNYITFVTQQRKIISMTTLAEVEQSLPASMFCRVHKSFIVSLLHIDVAGMHQLKINQETIPIGRTYREGFKRSFDRNR
ncbi:LytR/AlgR family response regulator transcription factor [Pedobacter metabolipauper]|uniref:LytTR family two component transcriptional regulator n=1 Tax=Pedobacter metabolipauper TaxID=425513 RepID=A0A4R6SWL8_9SPHI|nr:LytTR family DNA-binding domain-containing protein [Pedobacter metabolipauper]TDQ09786.1 LytTR family two component transcriptional regulator [Pedobacter metabolipauper]